MVIGLGLFVIGVVLRMKHRHRKRLARVGRRRMSGRLDIEDVRLSLVRQKEQTNSLVAISEAIAGVIPLFNTAQLRANIHRANMKLSVGAFVLISLVIGVGLAVGGMLLAGYPLPLLAVPALFLGMFLVNAFVRMRGNMIANRFMRQLPDAIDTVIRGIRSGLPVIECIGTVGQEYDDPIGGYFKRDHRAGAARRDPRGGDVAGRARHRPPRDGFPRRQHRHPDARPAAASPRRSATLPICCARASG